MVGLLQPAAPATDRGGEGVWEVAEPDPIAIVSWLVDRIQVLACLRIYLGRKWCAE